MTDYKKVQKETVLQHDDSLRKDAALDWSDIETVSRNHRLNYSYGQFGPLSTT